MKFIVQHLPHIVPSVLGFGVVVWLWLADGRAKRRGEGVHADDGPEMGARAGVAPVPRVPALAPLPRPRPDAPVRLEAARRGILLLGPILAAAATGAVIYAIDLDSGHPGRGLAWFHSGFGTLVLLLAVYKLADADPTRLRAGWRLGRVLETAGSLLLALLLVPLLITGIALLVAPSSASFAAYAHLVAGAWWTVLVLWHLWCYLVRAVRSVRRPGTVPNT